MNTVKTCTLPNCAAPIGRHGAKGYCPMHYKRYRANGDPLALRVFKRGTLVHAKVVALGWDTTPRGCWEYRGTRDPDGYGTVSDNRKPARVHRIMYEMSNGAIPNGMVIRHTCDNTSCINPEHLLVGTHRQNSQDAVDRERSANGERHGMNRITDEQVQAIRHEYAYGATTQRALARKCNCSQAQVWNIVNEAQRAKETHRPSR